MLNVQRISFQNLPESMESFCALPQAEMNSPFFTAALTVVALNTYAQNKELSYEMLDYLRGPRPMSPMEKQFIRDRFIDGKDYIPRSYFEGALPANDYTPQLPFSVLVGENPYSFQNEGYAKLFLQSGGADSPREIVLRLAKDGKWYLWDQFLLAGIREPESSNPWA